MRQKFLILILIPFILYFHTSLGDEVKLIPENITVNEYDSFTLTLTVNTSEKLSGFQDTIYYPISLNITPEDIILSNISNSANLKNVSIEIYNPTYNAYLKNIPILSNLTNNANSNNNSVGIIIIKLWWFSNYPSGNFTIATLKFRTLNNGTYKITQKPVLSDENGDLLKNVTYNSVNVTIIGLNSTIVEITPINPKVNENFDTIVSIKNAKGNITNITGTIYYPNLTLVNLNFYYLEDNISKVNLNYNNNSLSFFINLNTSKENFDLMKLTFFTNKTGNYIINASIKINGNETIVKPANFTIGYGTITEKYVGFHTTEQNISYGDAELCYIEAKNIDANISEIKGKITYNSSVLKISDISISLNTIEKNWTVENGTLNFDIKINGTKSGNFTILSFWIEPLKNENLTTELKISYIYLFDENGEIVEVPLKDTMTIHIIPIAEENISLPKAYFVYEIVDNYEVHFYSLCEGSTELHYYWNFGDNSTSTSPNPIHKYKKEGVYIVKLKVNDTFGHTSYDECVIEIKKLNPINVSLSNRTIYLNGTNETNVTIYCNITVKNPFNKKIRGYIYFVDYGNYIPNETSIEFELQPNETKIFSIPINISQSTEIKGYVIYYMPYKRLKDYIWNFKESVEINKPKKVKFNDYYYNIKMNQSKVIIKINKIVKNYTVTKRIDIENEPNIWLSLIGFLIGLIIILIIR
ncbi:PKD domain-containing protein [Methanocaldococcus sp.]